MNIVGFDRRDFGMLVSLFKLNVADRYLGSGLGLIWAVLSPLFLMGIFTFVFTFVFPGRLPGREGAIPYVIWLLSGYGPWLAISEGLSASTTSVVGNAGIVKNVAFKSELLPVVGALTGLFPLLVSFAVIVALYAVSGEVPSPALLTLPITLFLGTLFVSGLGLFLAALNVFVRDTALALPNVLTLLLFSSPIFYPLSSYPVAIARLLQFNPFYVIAALFRAPIIDGSLPPLWMFIYLAVVASVIFAGGLMWFRRLKSFFDARL
ncbi:MULTISPECIES: ABC transporter permease [Bradyrhizobium]|uniref:Transport permease protein n=1 Tax=Bradyrhizobium brasilense TaxID=1419277 RepID=A0ABY8JQ03_9BRAD|nr:MULTISPECIES: ABC transporter permease [Bradyrhizobium]WFU66919.1 ABC transporter permease [Bradyrhizobium brasilense]